MPTKKGIQIRGVTIEIGGDTTKLQTALKGVENKLKDTQNALRDVNKLLKLDPGNVELLTQKQKALNDSFKASEEKLKILEEAAEEAYGTMVSGADGGKKQYDAIQREIIATKQEMERLTGEMKNFGSVAAQQVAAAGEKIKDLGGKIEKVGTGLTKYVTAPIVAAGAASVAAFNEVDEGLDIIVKKTGATGKALKDMEDRAKNLATSIPTDFQTAGEAIGEVNTRFGLTGQELEDLSAKFIKFAQLNDTSVSSSIDNVQAAMAAFNLDASMAGVTLDILNKAGQDTGTSLDKLTGDLTTNAAALQEMGFSIQGATGFLANLNKNGLDSGTVLTGMKKALQNATKDGKSMSQALNEMQRSIIGAKSETKAMQKATELFGSKAAPTLVKALREGRLSFDDIANSVKDWSFSVENTFEQTLDPIDEFKTALNELKIIGMELVEAAAPMIKTLADMLKTAIGNIRKWWEGLSPLAQETIVKAGAIAAAVGPVLIVVGKVASAVGSIMTLGPKLLGVIDTVKTAVTALWGVLAANPIAAVIAAVAALVAGFIYLWNTSEDFRQFWINLWDGIKAVAEKAAKAIVAIWEGLKTAAKTIWEGIKEGISNAADATGEVLEEKWGRIKQAYEEHGGGMTGIAAGFVQAIKEKLTLGFDLINKLTGGKLDSFKEKVTGIFNDVKEFIRNTIEKIKDFFNFKWELPKIPLPHFKIEGDFSIVPPRVPHITVDWYKKAMENGMILNSPTIFGASGNKLLGGGDAGPEAVVGVDSLRKMIASAVSSAGSGARQLTVILELDRTQLARAVYDMNTAEMQRVGVRLAGD